MNSDTIMVYIIGGVVIGALLILLGVLIYGFNQYSKMGDGYMMSRQRSHILGVGMLIVLAVSLVTTAGNVLIPQVEESRKSEVKQYNDSLKSGYTLYYEGQKSTGDAINVNKDTISDYDISYDKDKRIVRVTKRARNDTTFIPLPIFYH